MTIVLNGTTGVTFPAGGLGNPVGAVVGTTDTQTLTNKTLTTPNINSAQVDTVSGTAPLYFARAWVNFNGTGTVAIRASGNVSSITDNGTGLYVVNFTTAMTDTSYAAVVSYSPSYGISGSAGASIAAGTGSLTEVAPTTTTFAFGTLILTSSGTFHDPKYVNVSVFR